jgi:hypothetical protein
MTREGRAPVAEGRQVVLWCCSQLLIQVLTCSIPSGEAAEGLGGRLLMC